MVEELEGERRGTRGHEPGHSPNTQEEMLSTLSAIIRVATTNNLFRHSGSDSRESGGDDEKKV